jgi:membrane-bound lytic murein transglycosylase
LKVDPRFARRVTSMPKDEKKKLADEAHAKKERKEKKESKDGEKKEKRDKDHKKDAKEVKEKKEKKDRHVHPAALSMSQAGAVMVMVLFACKLSKRGSSGTSTTGKVKMKSPPNRRGRHGG